MSSPYYHASYSKSHALVIGINKYENTGPLTFAVNDATAVAKILEEKYGFAPEDVTLLLDEGATRSAIMSSYMRLSDSAVVGPDDRLFVFFAGHGHTATGRRGETGFLVPVDGDAGDLATLIKWGELTGNADLIAAKHIFFLMDACYGGLAITRKTVPPGSMRLLEDMLQRFARQVLTAGKADELVSDGGGTRPGHSIFTAHVLDALDGAAAATEGVITANGVMAYVYQKVGSDPLSNQTPHYGFLEGDGDFIFSPVITASENEETGEPTMVQTPSFEDPTAPEPEATVAEQFKRLIADPADKIRLDDFVNAYLRQAVQAIGMDKFPVQGQYSDEEFAIRLKAYEEAMVDLETAVILLARWATPEQLPLIEKIFIRIGEIDKGDAGLVPWIKLGWYPLQLLMYVGGISALSQGRFDTLKACLLAPVAYSAHGGREAPKPVVIAASTPLLDVGDQFKTLPGMDRRYTPRSDHLLQVLQPILEDQLFLGKSYEQLFDEFEIMLALTYADARGNSALGHVWGPPGRFAWKHSSGYDSSSYAEFVKAAKLQGTKWPALLAGFFQGSAIRFAEVSDAYTELIGKLGWW